MLTQAKVEIVVVSDSIITTCFVNRSLKRSNQIGPQANLVAMIPNFHIMEVLIAIVNKL